MSDSETQSDYKIIKTKIDLMEDMLDNHIKNNGYPTLEQVDPKKGHPEDFQFGELQYPTSEKTQKQNTMSLSQALELVLEMAENGRKNYSPDSLYRSKYDTAIAKVKHFNKQL